MWTTVKNRTIINIPNFNAIVVLRSTSFPKFWQSYSLFFIEFTKRNCKKFKVKSPWKRAKKKTTKHVVIIVNTCYTRSRRHYLAYQSKLRLPGILRSRLIHSFFIRVQSLQCSGMAAVLETPTLLLATIASGPVFRYLHCLSRNHTGPDIWIDPSLVS